MLPSAEFIFLRVAYREVFWEELSRPFAVLSTCNSIPQLRDCSKINLGLPFLQEDLFYSSPGSPNSVPF